MKKQTKKTLWRGLTSTSAVLMVVSLFGTQCAITYTGTLNSYLGTTTSRIVSTGDPSAEDTNYYTSEFGDYSAENLQKLIQATYDESVLEQEEGSVLLRNNNSALPLSPNSHVTLFGHAVVQPVYAPGGANSGAASTGTYVIDLYQALKDVGFSINDTLYDAYKNSSTSRVASNNLTAISMQRLYWAKNLSLSTLRSCSKAGRTTTTMSLSSCWHARAVRTVK